MPLSARRPAALLLAGALLFPLPAAAHAIVLAATPAIGATVAGPSVAVALRFNTRIDQARSRLALRARDGAERPLPVIPSDRPDTLAARATGLAPGSYRLRWQVLAIDGHITRGEVPFAVAD